MGKIGWLLTPVLAVLLATAVACGGGNGNSDSSGDNGGSGQIPVSQELNLGVATQSLLDVRSFRFDMAMKIDVDMGSMSGDDMFGAALLALFGNIAAEGAYVAPDRFETKMKMFGMEFHQIQIGDETWINDGSGWEMDPSGGDFSFFGDSPLDMALDFLPAEVLTGARTSQETVNGMRTLRYSFDKGSLMDLADLLGEDMSEFDELGEMNLDVWVTEENIPVKVAMKMSGVTEGTDMSIEFSFEIKDLNADIRIERPN